MKKAICSNTLLVYKHHKFLGSLKSGTFSIVDLTQNASVIKLMAKNLHIWQAKVIYAHKYKVREGAGKKNYPLTKGNIYMSSTNPEMGNIVGFYRAHFNRPHISMF